MSEIVSASNAWWDGEEVDEIVSDVMRSINKQKAITGDIISLCLKLNML